MMLFMIGVSVVWIGLYIGGARSRGLREKPVRARGWVPTASAGVSAGAPGSARQVPPPQHPRQVVGKALVL